MTSISCIVPCFNASDTLRRAVYSVINQTSPVQEIILIDDCSTDKTWDLIEDLGNYSPLVVHARNIKNIGPAATRNVGWSLAKSEWLAFLDADDTWHPQKIELVRKLANRYPNVSLVGHLVDVRLKPFNEPEAFISDEELFSNVSVVGKCNVKFANPFSTPSVLVRRDVPYRFDEDMRYIEDYLLWSSLVLNGIQCMRININLGSLYKARYGSGGLSLNTSKMREGEIIALGKLRDNCSIGRYEYYLLYFFWYLKYIKRVLS